MPLTRERSPIEPYQPPEADDDIHPQGSRPAGCSSSLRAESSSLGPTRAYPPVPSSRGRMPADGFSGAYYVPALVMSPPQLDLTRPFQPIPQTWPNGLYPGAGSMFLPVVFAGRAPHATAESGTVEAMVPRRSSRGEHVKREGPGSASLLSARSEPSPSNPRSE